MESSFPISSFAINMVSSVLKEAGLDLLKDSSVNKEIQDAFDAALKKYCKNTEIRKKLVLEIEEVVTKTVGVSTSNLKELEVYKKHTLFFKEFDKQVAQRNAANNYIEGLRLNAIEEGNARIEEVARSNEAILIELKERLTSEKKEEMIKPLKEQIEDLQASLDEKGLNKTEEEDVINQLILLQNKISLTLENWNIIVNHLKESETLNEQFEKIALLFLQGEYEEIIHLTNEDELFESIGRAQLKEEEAKIEKRISLDVLIFKANVFELLDHPEKAKKIYTKIIIDVNPSDKKHYSKPQIHFFNNQDHLLFHHSIFKQLDFAGSGFGYESDDPETSLEIAVVFNSYNKMLYQNKQNYKLDPKERDLEIVETTLMKSLIPLSEGNLFGLLFNYYWDGYRVLRYVIQSFDYIKSNYEKLKSNYCEVKFNEYLVDKIGYYGYTKFFFFEANIFQKTKKEAFLNDQLDLFKADFDLNDATLFGNYLALANFGLFNSVLALLEGDIKTAQKFNFQFSVPIFDQVVSNNGLSIDKKKTLFWEYFYGQMVFIELGIKVASTLKNCKAILSHSKKIMSNLWSVPKPFNLVPRSFDIADRAIRLQALIQIKIYTFSKDLKDLDSAISALFMSHLEKKGQNRHVEFKHEFVDGYVLFKIWEKQFPEMYEIDIYKGKDLMGEKSKMKAIEIWKEISDSDRDRLIHEYPGFSFDDFNVV